MAHKTFISYKYSEAQNLRDKIIDSLGEDAKYYQGETEPRFKLYEYPELPFQVTKQISNLIIN